MAANCMGWLIHDRRIHFTGTPPPTPAGGLRVRAAAGCGPVEVSPSPRERPGAARVLSDLCWRAPGYSGLAHDKLFKQQEGGELRFWNLDEVLKAKSERVYVTEGEMDDLVRLLGPARCFFIAWPLSIKDAGEFLVRHGAAAVF